MQDEIYGITEAAVTAGRMGEIGKNSGSGIFWEFLGLLFILIVVFFLLIYIKKKSENIFNKGQNIKELDRFYFFPKTFLSIVKLGEEFYLMSVNENKIDLIKKIEEKELVDKLKLEESGKGKTKKNFSDFINIGGSNFENIKDRLKNMRQNNDE